jgi:hypothetical protein
MIPNNIHFIFFGFTDFTMTHYLAVKSAKAVHDPDHLYIHYTKEPVNNPLWDDIKNIVELRYIEPPTHFHGVELKYFQYKADISRLEILIREGGIYLDIDVLSVRPVTELLKHSCVLGVDYAEDPDTVDLSKVGSIANAIIMSEPNHPFIVNWLWRTKDWLVDKPWAYHAVVLPLEMLKERNYNVHIEPRKSFEPFDWRTDYIFRDDMEKYQWLKDNAYTMHFWETIWNEPYLKHIDDTYLKTVTNSFTRFFGQYR